MPETYTDSPLLSDAFDRALLLATDHHRRQLRKGTTIPYVRHLIGVASLMLEMGGSETEAIGALLHDAVEDGGGPPMLARIEAEFGADAARIVARQLRQRQRAQAAVERAQARVHRRDRPQAARRAARLARRQAAQRPRDPARLPHPRRRVWTRFSSGDGVPIRWYYRGLYDAFDARRDALGPLAAPALEELGRTVDEIDRLAK